MGEGRQSPEERLACVTRVPAPGSMWAFYVSLYIFACSSGHPGKVGVVTPVLQIVKLRLREAR